MPAGNIWMRGILEEHYGVPHREMTWVVDRSEDVAVRAAARAAHRDGHVRQVAERHAGRRRHPGDDLAHAAAPFVEGDKRVARLFADYKQVELDYLPADRHLPDHARDHGQAGDRRQISLGRDQSGEGVRGRRSSSPTGASPTRAWCRSPGCAPRSRSRRRCSGAIPGSTA